MPYTPLILASVDSCDAIHRIVVSVISQQDDLNHGNQEILAILKQAHESNTICIWSVSQQQYLPPLEIIGVDLDRNLITIKVWSGNICDYKITDLAPMS